LNENDARSERFGKLPSEVPKTWHLYKRRIAQSKAKAATNKKTFRKPWRH
jgi:hypothetical protein